MIDFYVTLQSYVEDGHKSFEANVRWCNAIIKNSHQEDEHSIHYVLQGDWDSYQQVANMMDTLHTDYQINSIEHFEDC
jgi:hypothetical protein